MSFQHFRLNENTLIQTHPVHMMHQVGSSSGPQIQVSPHFSDPNGHNAENNKLAYGAGDTDDGYTLVFANLDAFNEWREKEEEHQVVEFVKGDTHGSKAVPPRFKDHTKLVCARHSRSGRKKYVKKHPERVRKVPSRKLDGQGCPASISFKTYHDTEEVRACYIAQHSHEIGEANLPFTRRGRKAAVLSEKDRSKKPIKFVDSTPSGESTPAVTPNGFQQAIAMVPPPANFLQHPPPPLPFIHMFANAPPPPPQFLNAQNNPILAGRWDNISTLFETIRHNARALNFEYSAGSIAALESVLLRLWLESPVQAANLPQQQQPPQSDQSIAGSSSDASS